MCKFYAREQSRHIFEIPLQSCNFNISRTVYSIFKFVVLEEVFEEVSVVLLIDEGPEESMMEKEELICFSGDSCLRTELTTKIQDLRSFFIGIGLDFS